MKYPQYADLPAWHVWSDGRKFTAGEAKRFRKMWKRCRLVGEKPRPFFVRVRAVIEAHAKFFSDNTAPDVEEWVENRGEP